MPTANIRRLAGLELFFGCRRAELLQIDRLGTTIDVPPGRTLCDEGADGAEFFVLLEGLVLLRTAAGAAALLRPGAWFGEVALVDGAPRRDTLTTRTPATVIVFGTREFGCMLSVAPRVRDRISRTANQVIDGYAPTREPWYQPLPSGFPYMSLDSS